MSSPAPRPAPLSIRLSDSERSALILRAGTAPISTYVKTTLFGGKLPSSSRSSQTLADRSLLAKVLATLGASQIAPNIAALAKAAESGSLLLDDAELARLRIACDDIRLIHNALMRSLGKDVRKPSGHELRAKFNRQSGGHQQ